MASKNKTTMVLLSILVIFILAMGVYFVYYTQRQQTFVGETCTVDTECNSGFECISGSCEKIITSTLKGKAATESVFAYDKAADTPSTSKLNAPLYLIESPVVTTDKVTGDAFAADGTTLSTSARTAVTEGLNVGDTIIAIAANNTYYGKWSAVKTIESQAENLDLDSYTTIGSSSGDIILKDEDESTVTPGGGATNLTLGASQTESFYELKIKNNNTNKAWNVGGWFIDEAAGTNISSFSGTGTTEGSFAVGYSKSTTGLGRTDTDDVVFTLAEPVLLLEYDYITIKKLQVQADGDGCKATSGEVFSVYVFDKAWYRSSKENAMKYGFETDADSPSDIGASDYSETYYCTA